MIKSPNENTWLYSDEKNWLAFDTKKYGAAMGVKRDIIKQIIKPAMTMPKKSCIVRANVLTPHSTAWLITGKKAISAIKINSL